MSRAECSNCRICLSLALRCDCDSSSYLGCLEGDWRMLSGGLPASRRLCRSVRLIHDDRVAA
ncbi:hypothetical protein BD413DRAFT_562152 [Trametes elegans]|nr:hypothetical protein BD413DRAFT_562152 [Trametes elegans]